MSDNDYSGLTTERIDRGLKFNRNHRFFLVYGKNTKDEFLTRSFYRASLRETLWATLKNGGFVRTIFYNAAEKFFFLDQESAGLAGRTLEVLEADRSDRPPAQGNRRQIGPLGQTRSVFAGARSEIGGRSIERSDPGRVLTSDGIIPMTRSRTATGMSDSAVITHFNDFITDGAIRTAIVVEELENLSRLGVQKELVARMGNWSGMLSRNRNVMVFVTDREPGEGEGESALNRYGAEFPVVANLIHSALGDEEADNEGSTLYVPSPFEEEVHRLLNESRLIRNVRVEWHELKNLAIWLGAENQPLRILDARLREMVDAWPPGSVLGLDTARQFGLFKGPADPRPPLDRLNELIGLEEVKKQVDRLLKAVTAQGKRSEKPGVRQRSPVLHLAFTGNPGTGKNEVARLMGELYRDMSLLRRGHCVERTSAALIAEHVGGTAPATNAVVDRALDGVLFIDEAYMLKNEPPFGDQAIAQLVARMENERHRLAVILAGYPDEMEQMIAKNVGLRSRIKSVISFKDFSPDELLRIFQLMIGKDGYSIRAEDTSEFRKLFAAMYNDRNNPDHFPPDENGKSSYANARTVRTLVEAMIEEHSVRAADVLDDELTLDDVPPFFARYLAENGRSAAGELSALCKSLDALVGLDPVKEFVHGLIEEQQALDFGIELSGQPTTRHMVFTGNPGTGKTTVAELVGGIYKSLGVLRRGHFVEARRENLVAGYLGQTAPMTTKVVEAALDGVLFIDEAYSLINDRRDSFGRECIDTLTPMLEKYRDRLVVIFAGYTREMKEFLGENANSGVTSRIGYEIEFPDYSPEELAEIFLRMARKDRITVPGAVEAALQKRFGQLFREGAFRRGNARDVRVKFYEKMIGNLRSRVVAIVKSGTPREEVPLAFALEDIPGSK